MNKPSSVQALEELGRVRLSKHFFMRDFLYSEISQIEGIPNIPDYPDRAIEAGRGLCEQLLEPLQERFGRIVIRSAYRAPAVNAKGAENNNQYSCAANEKNYAEHIWDYPDPEGHLARLPASWCRHCCPGMRSARTGRRWLVDSRQPAIRQSVLVSQAGGIQPALECKPEYATEHRHLRYQPTYGGQEGIGKRRGGHTQSG